MPQGKIRVDTKPKYSVAIVKENRKRTNRNYTISTIGKAKSMNYC